jgi:hypothetical protein
MGELQMPSARGVVRFGNKAGNYAFIDIRWMTVQTEVAAPQ